MERTEPAPVAPRARQIQLQQNLHQSVEALDLLSDSRTELGEHAAAPPRGSGTPRSPVGSPGQSPTVGSTNTVLPDAELSCTMPATPTAAPAFTASTGRPWRSAITVSWRWAAQAPHHSCSLSRRLARSSCHCRRRPSRPGLARSARVPLFEGDFQPLLEIRQGRHIFEQARADRAKLRFIDLAAQTAGSREGIGHVQQLLTRCQPRLCCSAAALGTRSPTPGN